MKASGRTRSVLEIHAATALFGLAGLFGKWIALSPLLIVLGRVVVASLALGLVVFVGRRSIRISRPGDRLLFIGLGVLLAVHWTAFFLSVQASTVAIGLLSYSTFPVFTAFLEPALTRKRLDPVSIVFAGLCLLGVFLIIPRFAWSERAFQGVAFGLAAGLTFSILSIVNRFLTVRHSSIIIAFWQDFIAAIVLLPALIVLRPVLSGKDIGLLVVLGLACTAGSHTLFIHGMRRITAQSASIIASLEPVYGIILAYAFLSEIPARRTIIGGAVILAAAIIISLRSLRESRPNRAF